MVEYRFDRATETYVFMEINGRFWGSLPLAIAAGVPFAAGLVETAGRGEPPPPFVRNYPEITCCYWIPATKSVLRVLFQASAIRDPLYELDRGGAVRSYLSVQIGRAPSELQSLMRISYAVFCLKKKKITNITQDNKN